MEQENFNDSKSYESRNFSAMAFEGTESNAVEFMIRMVITVFEAVEAEKDNENRRI